MALSPYLPTKKFRYLILTFVILVGSVLVFFRKTGQGGVFSRSKNNPALLSIDAPSSEADSDHDGLKDWEEVLWKTDPNNPDSDGDGTPDGEEVTEGRDPTKPGPDDKFVLPETAPSDSQDNGNQTEKLSRRFFAEYLTLKQKGLLDDGSKTQIIEELINNLPGKNGAVNTFSSSDLHIISRNDPAAMKKYANVVGLVLGKLVTKIDTDELTILQKAVQSGDEKGLAKLDASYDMISKMAVALSLMEVPSDLADTHLILANGFAGTATSILAMQEVFRDPALALGAINAYQYETEVVTGAFKKINEELKRKGIKFYPNEAGNIFQEFNSAS